MLSVRNYAQLIMKRITDFTERRLQTYFIANIVFYIGSH